VISSPFSSEERSNNQHLQKHSRLSECAFSSDFLFEKKTSFTLLLKPTPQILKKESAKSDYSMLSISE